MAKKKMSVEEIGAARARFDKMVENSIRDQQDRSREWDRQEEAGFHGKGAEYIRQNPQDNVFGDTYKEGVTFGKVLAQNVQKGNLSDNDSSYLKGTFSIDFLRGVADGYGKTVGKTEKERKGTQIFEKALNRLGKKFAQSAPEARKKGASGAQEYQKSNPLAALYIDDRRRGYQQGEWVARQYSWRLDNLEGAKGLEKTSQNYVQGVFSLEGLKAFANGYQTEAARLKSHGLMKKK